MSVKHKKSLDNDINRHYNVFKQQIRKGDDSMKDRYCNISENEMEDAREIAEMLKSLDEQDKKIVMVYIGALRDRKMYAAV